MDYTRLTRDQLIAQLEERDESERGGIRLTYKGQTPPWRIVRRVRPRRQKIETDLCIGDEADQDCNLIVEGENLQAMVSLYKYRGQVDLVLTDPPYNTGRDFRYNDKWDDDPNDPDLGKLVAEEDGSKHSKWLRFMEPRVWMMREMLKPNGVLAICIDRRELYRLGVLLDNIFGEENRLGVINWQKTTPKPQALHLSINTEYVLVYAKNEQIATTSEIERSRLSEARWQNPDKDDLGEWKQDNLTGKDRSKEGNYAIQSPFTGELHYPGERHWANRRSTMKQWLEGWGVKYSSVDLNDGEAKALCVEGWEPNARNNEQRLEQTRKAALYKLKQGNWPILYWGLDGLQKPVKKSHKALIKQGAVPQSFWLEDDEGPTRIDDVSWLRSMSGRSRDGVEELDTIMGKGHGFETVKPLKLFRKIIQIWCAPDGVVLDPFAGSGTTAHAVLELNQEGDANRRFVLVEQGRPNKRDDYARTLTAVRVTRAITGERVTKDRKIEQLADPLPGGFRFSRLTHLVDSDAVLALEREEMIELLITSHWDQGDRSSTFLRRLPAGTERHLFGVDGGQRGYFLVWEGPNGQNRLNRIVFKDIVGEAREHGLSPPYHVYARLNSYDGPNVEFYQIPDRILEKLGVNTSVEPFGADIRQGESAA